MPPLPLSELRLNLRSHIAALRWIGLLYRKPTEVRKAERSLVAWERTDAVLLLFLHALPYLILIFLGCWSQFGGLGQANALPALGSFGWSLVAGSAFGLTVGLAVGRAGGRVGRLVGGFGLGLAGGLTVWLTIGPAIGVAAALIVNAVTLLQNLFKDSFTDYRAEDHTDRLTGAFIGGPVAGLLFYFAGGPAAGLGVVLGFYLTFFRLYYYPFHLFWVWPRPHPKIYRFHPLVWDDLCLLPFPDLERLLAACVKHDLEAGEREINRLITEYPSQRPAALRAWAILLGRRPATAADVDRLTELLVTWKAGWHEVVALHRQVHAIATLQKQLDALDRPFLHEPFATLLIKELATFERLLGDVEEPPAAELRQTAWQWSKTARSQLQRARNTVGRTPAWPLFRARYPVDREHRAFVERTAIAEEIERRAMLADGGGLLIYGRRRMGKTTLLRNLDVSLPPEIKIANLSLQRVASFTSLSYFLTRLAREVARAIPRVRLPSDDLAGLEHLLYTVQRRLEAEGCRLLLTIDRYEVLHRKIGEEVLPVDFLAMVRESIQSHYRIVWTFSGRYTAEELSYPAWPPYLANVHTIEVTPFEPAETRLLLTEPLKHSSLWRDFEADRPHFAPDFWGDDGIERIHAETAGWPHLVQLVAETVVDLVNDAGAATVDDALIERALDRAVSRGNTVLTRLLERESRLPGEWSYLQAFRTAETQPPPADEAVDRSLRRRRLVLDDGDRYRLRVPLMARWLRQRI